GGRRSGRRRLGTPAAPTDGAAGVGLADGGDAAVRAAGLSLVPPADRSVSRRPTDEAADDLDDLDPERLCRMEARRRPLGDARLGAPGRIRPGARYFASTQSLDPAIFTATFVNQRRKGLPSAFPW